MREKLIRGLYYTAIAVTLTGVLLILNYLFYLGWDTNPNTGLSPEEIRMDSNPHTGAYVNLFEDDLPSAPKDITENKGYARIARACERASALTGVPASLLQAICRKESGNNPLAVSSCGAMGIMQLMPDTWIWVAQECLPEGWDGSKTKSPEDLNPWKAEDNILVGASLLAFLYNTNGCDWEYALDCYAVGETGAAKHRQECGCPLSWTQQIVYDAFSSSSR